MYGAGALNIELKQGFRQGFAYVSPIINLTLKNL